MENKNVSIITKVGDANFFTNGDVYVDYGDFKIAITEDGKIYKENTGEKRIKFVEEEY